MGEMRRVVFEGPGPVHAFTHLTLGWWEFERGVERDVPERVAEYVLGLNPWGADESNAVDYGCKIYREVGAPAAAAPEDGGEA